jgi:protein-export membrane protein SecD
MVKSPFKIAARGDVHGERSSHNVRTPIPQVDSPHIRWRFLLGTILLLLCFAATAHADSGTDSGNVPAEGVQVTLQVAASAAPFTLDDLNAAAQIIAGRLQALAIDDALVQVIGTDRLQVQFPNQEDNQAVIAAISQIGLLEFVNFNGLNDQAVELTGKVIRTSERVKRKLDASSDLDNPLSKQPFETILTGAGLKSAVAQVNPTLNNWQVAFTLTADGAKVFKSYTTAHIGQPLAIVLDGKVLSVPVIQSPLGDQGVITGNFTEADTRELAAQLQIGALPLPLEVISVDTVRTVEAKPEQ